LKTGHKITAQEEHPIGLHHSPVHTIFYKLQENSQITINIMKLNTWSV